MLIPLLKNRFHGNYLMFRKNYYRKKKRGSIFDMILSLSGIDYIHFMLDEYFVEKVHKFFLSDTLKK